ncbi:MAG TPA: hypothetical protein VGG35_22415 [Streptosporangiaceae bacterium]
MSASSFIASLVGSLAWPAVIIAILVIFHRQFGTMLERLARVRLGGSSPEADLDWNQTEQVIRQSLAAARPGGPSGGAAGSSGAASGTGGTGESGGVARPPQALVEDRWQALSGQLRAVVRPAGSVSEQQLAGAEFDQLMEVALRAGLLDAATVRSLDGLRHLRNLARTSPSLTPRRAQEFAIMADAVSYGMQHDSGSVWPLT